MANSVDRSDNESNRTSDACFVRGGIPDECHPGVRAIARYWESIRPARGLPGRQHFDPVAIPKLLANIRLVDVIGRPPRFRIRLTGTRLTEIFGASDTGRWLDEIFPDFAQTETFANYVRLCDTRSPNWRIGKCELLGRKEYVQYERVQLPFATDGKYVDMILIYGVFDSNGGSMR